MAEFKVEGVYSSTDWFTGGIHVYRCIMRDGQIITLAPVYYEIDGVYKKKDESFEVHDDKDGEYIVLGSYKGKEHRMYANS